MKKTTVDELLVPVSQYAVVAQVSPGKAYFDMHMGRIPREDVVVIQKQQYMIRLRGEMLEKWKLLFGKK